MANDKTVFHLLQLPKRVNIIVCIALFAEDVGEVLFSEAEVHK